jgi:hypothetical protein
MASIVVDLGDVMVDGEQSGPPWISMLLTDSSCGTSIGFHGTMMVIDAVTPSISGKESLSWSR